MIHIYAPTTGLKWLNMTDLYGGQYGNETFIDSQKFVGKMLRAFRSGPRPRTTRHVSLPSQIKEFENYDERQEDASDPLSLKNLASAAGVKVNQWGNLDLPEFLRTQQDLTNTVFYFSEY